MKSLKGSIIVSSEHFKQEKRKETEWKPNRELVLIRDSYTCVYCNFQSKSFMQVNHIGPENDFQPENLETVCKPCHSILHMGVNAKNNLLTIIERNPDKSQYQVIQRTREYIHNGLSWEQIEHLIIKEFMRFGGREFSKDETCSLISLVAQSIKFPSYRAYLPDIYLLVFHQEGPWIAPWDVTYPENVHKWGVRRGGF